jgi:hypothetical protein
LVFENNAYFSAVNCRKSQKSEVITSTPGHKSLLNYQIPEGVNAAALNLTDGTFYYGEVVNGLPSGLGLAIYRTDDRRFSYFGDWQGGVASGHGTMVSKNGETFDGRFERGKRTGDDLTVFYVCFM